MPGRGDVLFSMIYIDDLLDGAVLCATKDMALNNAYLVTGNDPRSLNETVGVIADALDVPRPRLHIPVMPLYFAGWVMEATLKPLGISPPLYRRRVNFFHGVAGKYDLDNPGHLPAGFEQYDRVAFVNTDRMRRYIEQGVVSRDAAVLVGFPKIDALVNGGYDGRLDDQGTAELRQCRAEHQQ